MKDFSHDFYVFAFGAIAAVIFLVLSVVVTESERMQWSIAISATDFATLLSGFGGAALGGLVSWLLAREAGRETLARDEAQRKANEKAMALSVMLKTQQIANGLHSFKKYFYTARQTANDNRLIDRPMWETTKPIISPTPSKLRYDAMEFLPLISAKRADLVDRCNILALRYEVNETIVNDYSNRRAAFHDLLAPYSFLTNSDGLVTTAVPNELKNQYVMRAKELEDIIRQLYSNLIEDAKEAASLCDDLSSSFQKYFGEDVYALKMGEEAI